MIPAALQRMKPMSMSGVSIDALSQMFDADVADLERFKQAELKAREPGFIVSMSDLSPIELELFRKSKDIQERLKNRWPAFCARTYAEVLSLKVPSQHGLIKLFTVRFDDAFTFIFQTETIQ